MLGLLWRDMALVSMALVSVSGRREERTGATLWLLYRPRLADPLRRLFALPTPVYSGRPMRGGDNFSQFGSEHHGPDDVVNGC